LCIFPVKSVRAFLPKEYVELAQGELKEYFPADFDIDLNGRTLPWEAVVLIPFVDEDVFIEAEQKLFKQGMTLSPVEEVRNTIKFVYNGMMFDKELKQGSLLPSTLKTMGPLEDDRTKTVVQYDYEKVGQYCFPSKLLPGVVTPQPGFPSLHWLNVADLDFADVYVQKVRF
jgi:5'-3' exonuclease